MVLMNLFAGQEQRHRRRAQTCGHGEGEVGRMESRVDTCTLPYGKEETRGNLLYDAGSSARCSVTTQRSGMGGWGGKEAQEGGEID